MREIKVLLAEDEALVRFVVAEELRDLGWIVTEVATADDGIEMLQSGERFDLIVTDINMPGDTDGLDLARVVRSVDASAKIAVMSGRPSMNSAADLCDLYLPKPSWDLGREFGELLGLEPR